MDKWVRAKADYSFDKDREHNILQMVLHRVIEESDGFYIVKSGNCMFGDITIALDKKLHEEVLLATK